MANGYIPSARELAAHELSYASLRKHAEQERAKRDTRITELEAALRAVEWMKGRDGYSFCPSCNAYRHNGHYPDCIVGRALQGVR